MVSILYSGFDQLVHLHLLYPQLILPDDQREIISDMRHLCPDRCFRVTQISSEVRVAFMCQYT